MSKSPNGMSMDLLKERGLEADLVERVIPHTRIKKDLFGCIDIVYLDNTIVGLQVTSDDTGGNSGVRYRKIIAEPRMRQWLVSGGRIVIHAWAQRGKPKRWGVTEREVTLADFEIGATP